jgi:putative transposase
VEYYRDYETRKIEVAKSGKPFTEKRIWGYDLRDMIIANQPEWCKKTPFKIKAESILDFCKNVTTAWKGYKAKIAKGEEATPPEFHFKSKKSPKQSCPLVSAAFAKNKGSIYKKFAGELHTTEDLTTQGNGRLKYENGRYHVIAIQQAEACESQASKGIVAIDPGIRSFITFYSGDACGKIGENDFKRIYRLCVALDKLISKRDKSRNHRQRRALRKTTQRIRWRIRDLVKELHNKVALWLCKNFDVILLPTFEVNNMVEKQNRKISNKTVRNMLNYSHYKFKVYLKNKAELFGVKVLDVNEAYSSKTASWTGEIKNIGGAKHITSGSITVDRDINGARGIMLRALRDSALKEI